VSQPSLFELPDDSESGNSPSPPESGGKARLRKANREQLLLEPIDLDSLVPFDHTVRVVWDYVSQLDLSAWSSEVKSMEGSAGRSATDPQILLALWLYATLDGVGSARALNDLCVDHAAYKWLCGGVRMNYHTLADFRTHRLELLESLLIDGVARLLKAGLVTMQRVAQDGMRVRASAGSSSFRRQQTLERFHAEARAQVDALREELETDPQGTRSRQQSARLRAAEERQARVAEALRQHPEVEARKKKSAKSEARASTTDPDARRMKMGDGGFRPAYNVQFVTDTQSQIILGVTVTNSGGDQGQLRPMIERLHCQYGRKPQEVLADAGFVKHDDIEALGAPEWGVMVYTPIPEPKTGRDRFEHLPTDSLVISEWRTRMGTAEAQKVYRERAATAECVNAIARNRGLQQFRVRGTRKVQAMAVWYALAHNVWRAVKLCMAPMGGELQMT
jgi:transposase